MHLSIQAQQHINVLQQYYTVYQSQADASLPSIKNLEQLAVLAPNDLWEITKKAFNNKHLLKKFITINPYNLNREDLEIMKSWLHAIHGNFYLYKLLKNHAVFVHPESGKAYGVKALMTPFQEITPNIPCYVNIILIPYKGIITYTGLFSSYPIYLGGGIRKNVKELYDTAKAQYGIITSLPHQAEDAMTLMENRLAFYVKNQSNFYRYEDEIAAILNKHPHLTNKYYHLSGKAFARSIAENLRQMDIEEGWFGIMTDMVVASGIDKKTLEANIQKLLPKERWQAPYLFQLKKLKKSKSTST